MMSVYGMQQLGKYLVPLFEGDNSKEAWDYVSFASTLGGMVINTAGVTLPHGMEHPASGLKISFTEKDLQLTLPLLWTQQLRAVLINLM